jgi:hypothetical protein
MLFDDDFLENIQEDPTTSIITVITTTIDNIEYHQFSENDYETIFEGFSLILSMIDSFEMESGVVVRGHIESKC